MNNSHCIAIRNQKQNILLRKIGFLKNDFMHTNNNKSSAMDFLISNRIQQFIFFYLPNMK